MAKEERRGFARLDTRLTITFKHLETGKVRRALTKNFGGGGMCLVTDEVLPSGTMLELEIKLPDRREPITSRASVMWSKPLAVKRKGYENAVAETGVNFISINPKDQTTLIQYARLNAIPVTE